tara:strand:+ start:112 stop:336 length:225 start_codon:yes stop_codon:yes gene_type:complete
MKMTFDHFDTQVSPEETQYYRDWLAWGEYMETINSLDDKDKAELDEIDMRIEQAESEHVVTTMQQLDKGVVKFA